MNAVSPIKAADLPSLLSPLGGGFFAGIVNVGGDLHAVIIAPKDGGEFVSVKWGEFGKKIEGADSVNDGLANTEAMAASGSEVAKQVRASRIGGHDDWHIPARDQLETLYRYCKPTEEENDCCFRDGENPSSVPVGFAYTPNSPAQCENPLFQEGGAEAFEDTWYWASTQYSARNAWIQYFDDGLQLNLIKDGEGRVRAVRTIPLSH